MNVDAARFDARPKLAFTADDRCDVAVKRLLGFFLAVMEANRPAVIADLDTEHLHDFRVAVRRSRSLLGKMPNVISTQRTKQARAFFSRLSKATNRQRDLDVMLLNFDFYRSLLPPRMRDNLDPIHGCVMDQRHAALDATVRFLRSEEYQRFVANWGRYLDTAPPRRPALANAVKPVKSMADGRIWKAYKRVMDEGSAINDKSPAEALHSLRKSCKTLRYLIEFFSSLYPRGKIKEALKILKRLQDNLGEYQDIHVHGMLLADAREALAKQGRLTPESDAVIVRVNRGLARLGAERRERFRKRFAGFGSESHQRLFRRMFRP